MKKKPQWRMPLLCISGSLLLYLALTLSSGAAAKSRPIKVLERESYGGEQKEIPVIVSGIAGEPVKTAIELQPRTYTEPEARAVFDRVMAQLGDRILLDNPSLSEVRSNLNLLTELEAEGVRLRWQSSIPDYLNHLGQVSNEAVPEAGEQGQLRLQLAAGAYKADYELSIRILPPADSREEHLVKQFLHELQRQEQDQKTQPQLVLPQEYEGQQLTFYSDGRADYKMIPVMGVLAAILLSLRVKEQERQQQKAREQQLLLDYSDVLTKLLVFIGAGMTVRLSWERIVDDYKSALSSGSQKPRHVYEEMSYACGQMHSGVSEGRVYREFGERCRLQPYLKLSSLLEQNRRTGTKNLSELMKKEVEAAFEHRKNLVRRLGEEASTKLAGPLFLMLGVIMILVLFPAIMNMQ